MTEATALLTVAEYRDVLRPQCLTHKARDHHPVCPRLTWSHAVEEADDDGRRATLPPVTVRKYLIYGFGCAIRPACLVRGSKDPVGVLRNRTGAIFAVDLGCRGNDYSAA